MQLNNIIFENYKAINFINATDNQNNQILELRNHVEIRKWMYSQNIISENDHQNFIQKLKQDLNNYYWSVFNEKEDFIGVIYLNQINYIHKHAYLGIYTNIASKTSAKGQILLKILKKIAFSDLKLHSLKLEVFSTNLNAINFYKREGFEQEGRLKDFIVTNNQWLDVLIFGFNSKTQTKN